MDERDMYPESSRSLESLREMRLQALLRDMIDAGGGSRAAALGVRYRTLSRAVVEPGGRDVVSYPCTRKGLGSQKGSGGDPLRETEGDERGRRRGASTSR